MCLEYNALLAQMEMKIIIYCVHVLTKNFLNCTINSYVQIVLKTVHIMQQQFFTFFYIHKKKIFNSQKFSATDFRWIYMFWDVLNTLWPFLENVCMYVCRSVYLYVCLLVCMSVCMSVDLYACMSSKFCGHYLKNY